jgi:hypothetical protein
MTVKVPEILLRGVEEEARRRGVPKSIVVRDCVEAMLRSKKQQKLPSCLDLVADLIASQRGPRDASVNRDYLDQAILADNYGACSVTPSFAPGPKFAFAGAVS